MPKPRKCRECNKHTISPLAQRCKRCYYKRLNIESVATPKVCADCGGPRAANATRCRDCWKAAIKPDVVAPPPTPVTATAAAVWTLGDVPDSTLFDDRWQTFNKWIGRSRTSTAKPPTSDVSDERIIFHSTDWHVPYLNETAFAWAVNQNLDATDCVIGGDFFNGGAASRFIETEFLEPRAEFEQAMRLFQYLSETYDRVYCNLGNHCDRYRRYFGSRIPPYMMFLVNYDPIRFICEGLGREHGISNIHIATPVLQDLDESRWLTMIGDCAFAHGETSSKVKMRPAENVARWTRRWSDKLATLPRVIVQEHNHYGGMTYDHETGCHLIQAPCLSHDHNYQAKSDVRGSPNTLGYTRIVQDASGRTDINRSRYYVYDAAAD